MDGSLWRRFSVVINQPPTHHLLDASILSGGVAFLLGILPETYQVLSVVLVILGILWYIRQFYVSFKKK